MALIQCPECGKEVSEKAKNCPNCGIPIDTNVYCPKCGSDNVAILSNLYKAASIFSAGIYAANNVKSNYRCKDCKHLF